MIVVSDTTPLISLMKASRLEVLKLLFGEVLIPTAVFDELTSNDSFKSAADVKDALERLKQSNRRISDSLIQTALEKLNSI